MSTAGGRLPVAGGRPSTADVISTPDGITSTGGRETSTAGGRTSTACRGTSTACRRTAIRRRWDRRDGRTRLPRLFQTDERLTELSQRARAPSSGISYHDARTRTRSGDGWNLLEFLTLYCVTETVVQILVQKGRESRGKAYCNTPNFQTKRRLRLR